MRMFNATKVRTRRCMSLALMQTWSLGFAVGGSLTTETMKFAKAFSARQSARELSIGGGAARTSNQEQPHLVIKSDTLILVQVNNVRGGRGAPKRDLGFIRPCRKSRPKLGGISAAFSPVCRPMPAATEIGAVLELSQRLVCMGPGAGFGGFVPQQQDTWGRDEWDYSRRRVLRTRAPSPFRNPRPNPSRKNHCRSPPGRGAGAGCLQAS